MNVENFNNDLENKHSEDAAANVVTLNPMSSRWTRRTLAGFPTQGGHTLRIYRTHP